MTVTDEMRAAFHKRSATVWTAREIEDAYLAMRALDPEFQELRKELAVSQAIRADLLCVLKVVNDRCLRLVALRPVAEAAVAWEEHPDMAAYVKLRQAVRALPPEWRG